MGHRILSILLFLSATHCISAQTIKVGPYLQDAEPFSIFVLWETDSLNESIVEWGLTDTLGNTTLGSAHASFGTARIHEVQLENLTNSTTYFYKVKTGNAVSDLYTFKTPPLASEHASFRMIAMSDMQRDGAFPNKFQEIIQDGVISYLDSTYGGDLVNNLALVLIPGDLVVNGNNYSSWESTFFTPSEDLFSHVPVYPVLGNHEFNSTHYFQYFKMPENGTIGFEEHWWYKDYGNLRIIGLDSNAPFDNQEQLDWLDVLLNTTCSADSIDFVFAQLHHPHKSELWTPGESDYTGDVIERLEQFSMNCGKPSIHFFGHTHGYSRGNSRDHKHLWINAATAGGAIDNWGEFPNFDYDEFSVSQDEYGFVSVEITDDADPKIVVKRISRGDQDTIINNIITDSITVRKNASTVQTPLPISPINVEIIPECVTLKANVFSGSNAASLHGQSHWQVATTQNGFANPTVESWKNYENWYYDIDTQAGDDLSDEIITGLDESTMYWWRVRYRDRELNWSAWSTPVSFTTGVSYLGPNLISNEGAEDSLVNWTTVQGIVEALADGACNGVSPNTGNLYFAVGGLCAHSTIGRCIQNVDVSVYSDSIDNGSYSANFGGFLSNYGGNDLPEMKLIFLDTNNIVLGISDTLSTLNSTWTNLNISSVIPALTRTIQVELKGTRNAGTDNDSYFDDVFLKVGATNINCSGIPLTNQVVSGNIHIDQFGYRPMDQKIAVLSDPQVGYNSGQSYAPGATIQVIDNTTLLPVFSATPAQWDSGNTHVQSGDKAWWFDFSTLTNIGEYYVFDSTNDLSSNIFKIGDDVYEDALRQSMRAFYFQRCGVSKTVSNGGVWNDGICHNHASQDLDCRLVTDPSNASLSKDLSGGWHDAGDYNKYVNYTHEPLHDLLFAYEDNTSIWGEDLNIPETGNGVPDILDEIKVELDWLLKMQESDGSVLMKVSVTGFQASSPPSTDTAVRRYGPAQASATRAAASIFAHASIIYNAVGMTVFADTLLTRAELAWDWVIANPAYSYYNNTGFSSSNPEVSESTQDDYMACAAVYLFAATDDISYRNYFDANYTSINPYSWGYWYLFQNTVQDAMLYYADLANSTPTVASNIQSSFVNSMHTNNADMLTAYLNETDAYRAHLGDNDYTWGNNREKSHATLMFNNLKKYDLNNGGTNDSLNYTRAADGYMHFMHGVNPLNKIMLSNMYGYGGDDCANEIYHAWFNDGTDYDNALTSLYGPPPGIIPGGINPNYAPDPSYAGPTLAPPLNQPIQKSYKDWNTGYPENSWEVTENAITYQAAYVNMISKYVSTAAGNLPIDLLYFHAKLLDNKHVELTWKTASETNNDVFIIEKSTDGQSWYTLHQLKGAGTSIVPHDYLEFDKNPNAGQNYYRIKQVDFGGNSSYSPIRIIYYMNNQEATLQVYPNPSKHTITFTVPTSDANTIEVYNLLGQKMYETFLANDTMKRYTLDISKFSTGIYYLVIGEHVSKFVKK